MYNCNGLGHDNQKGKEKKEKKRNKEKWPSGFKV
jgi:hypothetical protein